MTVFITWQKVDYPSESNLITYVLYKQRIFSISWQQWKSERFPTMRRIQHALGGFKGRQGHIPGHEGRLQESWSLADNQ